MTGKPAPIFVQRGERNQILTLGLINMDNRETPETNSEMLIGLTADVVAAYVSNNPVPAGNCRT